jgi:hypothetical protein
MEKLKIVKKTVNQELLEFDRDMNALAELRELKERGKEVLRLWKQCKTASDIDLRRRLAIEFYQKLCWAVTPLLKEGETDQCIIDANRATRQNQPGFSDKVSMADSYVDIVLNKGGELEIGNGTKGERIFFDTRDFDRKLSEDGRVRWMRYRNPAVYYSEKHNSVDARIQKRIWWDTFISTFGSNEVDLTADIK